MRLSWEILRANNEILLKKMFLRKAKYLELSLQPFLVLVSCLNLDF